MAPIIFSILSVAACTFLAYVFMQFRRELLHMRKSSGREPRLTEADVRRIEAALMLTRMSSHASGAQRATKEAVMRKEMLTSAIAGLVGLLAPFIFVLLLNWNSNGLSR
jgi:hypothetical protein